MSRTSFFSIILLFSASLLSGCGFHLPDEVSTANAIPELRVTGDWHHPFFRKTVDLLRVRGVKVYTDGYGQDGVDGNDPSLPTLSVPAPSVSQPLMSVNTYMSALEYSLIVSTADILTIPGHRPILMRNSLTRTYLNKAGRALATSNEYEEILDETYQELASQLVMRISYLGRQSDPDAVTLTPAQLTEAKDDPASKIDPKNIPAGMTLMDALRMRDENDAETGEQIELGQLNNGSKILNSNSPNNETNLNRSYNLPKVKPVLKNEAPELDDSDF